MSAPPDSLELVETDDGTDPYSQWVSMVRNAGGTPSTLPGDAVAVDSSTSDSVFRSMVNAQAIPAARYSVARAAQLGITNPDASSRDGQYVYLIAPQDVIDWVAQNGIVTTGVVLSKPAIDRATENSLPEWFKSLRTGAKWAIGLTIVGGGLYLLGGVRSLMPARANPRGPRR